MCKTDFKIITVVLFMLPLFAGCGGGGGSDDDEPTPTPTPTPSPGTDDDQENVTISFTGILNSLSRATETQFENGDAISVYAVKIDNGLVLKSSGNYADNRRYTYDGASFTSSNAISIEKDKVDQLAYYAIYPYSTSASANMTFTAKSDQSTHANLTASDFCSAYVSPSANTSPSIKFNHRMAKVRLQLTGNLGSSVKVSLVDVYGSMTANINDNTFAATGGKSDILMHDDGDGVFEAFIAPQTISSGVYCFKVEMDGTTGSLYFENDQTFKSGTISTFTYEITKEKTFVYVDGQINEWYY